VVDYVVVANQERYLLAERFTEASYPIPYSYRIRGAIDAQRLQSAIDAVVARHPILRSEFHTVRNGFVARVLPDAHIALGHDRMDKATPAQVRARITDYFSGKLTKFGPDSFTRALLVTTGHDQHVLTLSLHHAIGDGFSMDTFAEEVFEAYRGAPAPAPGQDYYDVMAANPATPESIHQHQGYWVEALAGVEDVASLRPDMNDPAAEHGEVTFLLDYPTVRGIAAKVDASPFVLMSTVAAIVLGRYTGSSDVQFTFQSSGRAPFPDCERVIGPFSNSVVLRTRLAPGEDVGALIQKQKGQIAEALSHELYPYHLVVRETGVQPRFGINWFPSSYRPKVEGLEISDRDFLFYDSNYDLNIRFVRDEDVLRMLVHYDATQYSRARVEQIAAAFQEAVTALDERLPLKVSEVLPPPVPLAAPAAPPSTGARIFDAFLAQAAATPSRVALLGADETFTYAQVEAASAGLARRLVAAGLGVGNRVAILAERGPTLVWTMLGVSRTGATMVPLDSDYPEERLRTLLAVSRADALVIPAPGPTPEWASGLTHVFAARDEDAVRAAPACDPEKLAAGLPGNPAYMLFTSGSTGTPKCIATSHDPVLNFLRWQRETFQFTSEDRFTNLCGLAHDMMVRDVFAPLSIGAQLAIPRQEDIFKPGALLEWCLGQQPSITHLTPAMGRLLNMARQDGQVLPLRLMFFGGDRLQPEVVHKMRELAPRAEIVNFYGATETPQAAAFHRTDPEANWLTHPIGHGIDHFSIRIVDAEHRPVPDGAPGEIAVLTPYLSLGYVRDGEIQPHPEPGVYFTGDTGFVLPSGEIMFAGRTDDQINIRGYRIELEEINAAFRSHPGVREAQVLIEGKDNPRLVGFAAGDDLNDDDLYAWLNRKLPHYMVPSDIVCLAKLPLLPNGKLDRRALLALPRAARQQSTGRDAETEMERNLVAAWKQSLSLDRISPEQSFAQLRGDSLSYVQIFLATESLVGTLPDNWQTMPIAEIAKLKPPKARWYKWVDSAMLVRALAIVSVVGFHLEVFSVGGGATTALFMVSGFLMGKLQLREAVRTRSSLPLWSLTGRVLAPSAIYCSIFYFSKVALGKPVNLSVLLMYGDFIDYRDSAAVLAQGHAWFLWFIGCFFHMSVAMSAISAGAMRWFRDKITVKGFALTLFLAALPARFILPPLLDPSILTQGIPLKSVWGHLPTTHFATLLLGACLANVETRRGRALWCLTVVAYSLATYYYVPGNGFLMMAAFGVMLLYAPRLPVPSGLHILVLFLSGSSLFIYLTHQQAAQAFRAIGVPTASVLLVVVTLLFGVGLWLAWQQIRGFAHRHRRAPRAAAAMAQDA